MANLRYKPSGRASFWGVLLMLFGGLIGSTLLLSVYVYGLGWMKNAAFRIILLVALLFLLSLWMIRLSKSGRFRSPGLAFWFSLIAIAGGLYVHYAVYAVLVQDAWQIGGGVGFFKAHLVPETFIRIGKLIVDPAGLWKMLTKIREVGFWSLDGQVMRGLPLLLIWVLEMLLIMLVPSFRAAAQSRRIYSEEQNQWLDQKRVITVRYIRDHRSLRRQLIKGENDGLLDLHYHKRKGREAHGTVTFYHHKGNIGPFISMKMVKAVQIGPRRTKHYFIPMLNEWEIGQQEAEKLYNRLEEEMKLPDTESEEEKVNGKKAKDRYFWSNKREEISFAVRRRVEDAKSDTDMDDIRYDGNKVSQLEEVTVYAPTITPEMEQSFLEKKAKEEQERIWAENREEVRNRRKKNKNKRHSTRIK